MSRVVPSSISDLIGDHDVHLDLDEISRRSRGQEPTKRATRRL
jgi:hypothetical protein